MSIGNRITELRKRKNLTQEGLAKRVGISRAALSHYEKDRREPDYETLNKLSDFFDVSTDYLLGRVDTPEMTEEDKKSAIMDKIAKEFPDANLMFHDLANMTAEDLQDVYDYIKFKKSQKGD